MYRHRMMTLVQLGLVIFNQPAPESGTPSPTPTPTPSPTPAAKDPAGSPAQETDWKAEARKHEQRAKENKAAADELAALKESQKSDDQKRNEETERLRAENAAFKQREQVAQWAKEIVDASDVPDDKKFAVTAALHGSTREELEASLEQIKSLMPSEKAPKKGAIAPYVPGEGNDSTGNPKDTPLSPGIGTLRHAYATETPAK